MGSRLTEQVKKEIARAYIYLKEANRSAGITADPLPKEVMKETKRRLNANEPSPSLRTFQDYVKKMKEREGEISKTSDDIDGPWTMGTLGRHYIPPDALPSVLEACREGNDAENYFFETVGVPYFSVREALWASRLYTLLKPPDLYIWSKWYASNEQACELACQVFDSSELDKEVLQIFLDPKDYKQRQAEKEKKFAEQPKVKLIDRPNWVVYLGNNPDEPWTQEQLDFIRKKLIRIKLGKGQGVTWLGFEDRRPHVDVPPPPLLNSRPAKLAQDRCLMCGKPCAKAQKEGK